jgi:hypothetical protein
MQHAQLMRKLVLRMASLVLQSSIIVDPLLIAVFR